MTILLSSLRIQHLWFPSSIEISTTETWEILSTNLSLAGANRSLISMIRPIARRIYLLAVSMLTTQLSLLAHLTQEVILEKTSVLNRSLEHLLQSKGPSR